MDVVRQNLRVPKRHQPMPARLLDAGDPFVTRVGLDPDGRDRNLFKRLAKRLSNAQRAQPTPWAYDAPLQKRRGLEEEMLRKPAPVLRPVERPLKVAVELRPPQLRPLTKKQRVKLRSSLSHCRSRFNLQ